MSTDVDKPSSGVRQGVSIAERKKRKNPMAFHPGNKCMSLGVIFVLLTLTMRMRAIHEFYVEPVQVERQNRSSSPHLGTQDLALHSQPPVRSWDSDALILMSRPTVHEAFEGKITLVLNETNHLRDELNPEQARSFKTVVEPNRNIFQYGLTVFNNVCARPDGAIVTVGISDEELSAEISKVPQLLDDWSSTYNCSAGAWECIGYDTIETGSVTSNARWIPGTTTHIIPYKENVLHNFADRLWPHLVNAVHPLNSTIPHPPDHFLVHRINTWLFQAGHNMDRNTFMYQIRILGESAPAADFLAMDGLDNANDLVCFEKLVLACTTCDRLSSKLGENVARAAIFNYRNRGLQFLGIPEPVVPLPPRRLRVAVYGRWDTKRRRIVNMDEVAHHLGNYTNPPLIVTNIDKLLASHRYNQSLPEVVSLITQTDILITAHGASTWMTIFMPLHAAVVEIEGPCGPYTWIGPVVKALGLRHDTSNPWGLRVASSIAGNTTECADYDKTPDMTVDLRKLDDVISSLGSAAFGADDSIARHWKHNWETHDHSSG